MVPLISLAVPASSIFLIARRAGSGQRCDQTELRVDQMPFFAFFDRSTNLSISFSTVSHLSLFLFFYLHIPSSAIKGGKNPSCEIISFSFVFLYTHMPFSPSFLLDTKETRQKV